MRPNDRVPRPSRALYKGTSKGIATLRCISLGRHPLLAPCRVFGTTKSRPRRANGLGRPHGETAPFLMQSHLCYVGTAEGPRPTPSHGPGSLPLRGAVSLGEGAIPAHPVSTGDSPLARACRRTLSPWERVGERAGHENTDPSRRVGFAIRSPQARRPTYGTAAVPRVPSPRARYSVATLT